MSGANASTRRLHIWSRCESAFPSLDLARVAGTAKKATRGRTRSSKPRGTRPDGDDAIAGDPEVEDHRLLGDHRGHRAIDRLGRADAGPSHAAERPGARRPRLPP